MKNIKICYTDRKNIGDAVNPLIIENVLGVDHEISNTFLCDMTGIGSGLRRYFLDTQNYKNMCRYMLGHLVPNPLIFWSAGFLTTPSGDEKFIRRSYKVASTRGELSRMWMEKLLKCDIECTTGDAGLLSSMLIEEQEKKYAIGIIPHVKEKNEEAFFSFKNQKSNAVIIDVEGDIIETLKLISSCETIISSSLHGLIIADSFGIPNMHVTCTNKLSGDGFKFEDYYSSFNIKHNSIDIKSNMNLQMSDIMDSYAISKEMVDVKKAEIVEAFHKYIK